MNKIYKVAILGYGTVGKGVKKLIDSYHGEKEIRLIKIFDMPNKKEELGSLLETDYTKVCTNKNIDIIFECLGGDDLPYKANMLALKNGKSVITSNKETVSKHLDEYLKTAREHSCYLMFEASVGGGIPLIRPIIEMLKYDTINSYEGILNGTTNFILTKMFDDNFSFEEALKIAQEKGFAERDPSADLMGVDLVRKGVILSSLIFNSKLKNSEVNNFGIQNIDAHIIKKIKKQNKVLKMIVSSHVQDKKLYLDVWPMLLNQDDPLAYVKDEFNSVVVNAENNSRLEFIGKGAGMLPTASAMMQDLSNVLSNNGYISRDKVKSMKIYSGFSGKFFVVNDKDKTTIIENPSLDELKKYKFIAKIKEE